MLRIVFAPRDPSRDRLLTASTFPAYLGFSKYGSREKEINRRTKRPCSPPNNFHLQRGHEEEANTVELLAKSQLFQGFRHNVEHTFVLDQIGGTPDMVNENNTIGVEIKNIFLQNENLQNFLRISTDFDRDKLIEVIEQQASPLYKNNVMRMHLLQCIMCMAVLNADRNRDTWEYYLVQRVCTTYPYRVFIFRLLVFPPHNELWAILRIIQRLFQEEIDFGYQPRNDEYLRKCGQKLLRKLHISNMSDML